METYVDAGAVPWRLEIEPAQVQARLDWARRRGHPQYLWPEVAPGDWRSSLRALEGLVRTVLTEDGTALMSDAEIAGGPVANLSDGGGVRALGVAGFTSGLGPLIGYWIERGRVAADSTVASLFAVHLEQGRLRAARQAAELARAADVLRGMAPVLVKSMHTGTCYFVEPGVRPSIDIDLVVEPADFGAAEAALKSAGYVFAGRQLSPRKSDWRVPDAVAWPTSLELLHSGSQYAVDLHDSLTRNFFGVRRITPAPLRALEPVTVRQSGFDLRVLPQPVLLAYHALHASEGLDNLTLIRILELVSMIRTDTASGALDWDAFISLLDRCQGLRFVYPALALAERFVPGTLDSAVINTLERAATKRMRRVVDPLSPADAQRLDVLTVQERFMWSDSAAEHVRRVAHMLLPAPVGHSPRLLAKKYRERAYRLLRRNVMVRRGGGDQSVG